MDGITNFLSTMSMAKSMASVQTDASLAMLKNAMSVGEAASGKLIESISEAAPPAGVSGALMDVRA